MKDIYTFEEWKVIHPDTRVDIITVAEDIRQGGLVNLFPFTRNQNNTYESLLINCFEYLDLCYKKDDDNYYLFSKDKSNLEKKVDTIHSLGLFLGYPRCCVRRFSTTLRKEREYIQGIINLKEVPLPQGVAFNLSKVEAIKNNEYNFVLDYRLHVPCSINCEKSIELSEKVKKCLEENDQDAAKYCEAVNYQMGKFDEKSWKQSLKYLRRKFRRQPE
jgi:hypothetical protein